MFCHKCGSKVDDDASFCHRCGENIAHGTSQSSSLEIESTNTAKTKLTIKTVKFVGAALVAIIVLVLIMSGTLQNIFDKLMDINREIENNATGAITVTGMQSADDIFPTTSGTTPLNSAESSFAWIEEAHIVTEDDFFKSRYIVGAIQNTSDTTFTSASVEFILYDSSGNQIDTTRDVIHNFVSGNTWRFKAIILSDNVSSFEFLHATKTYS